MIMDKIYGTTLYIGTQKLEMLYGFFITMVFQDLITNKYIIALINENTYKLSNKDIEILYVRIHSSCVTSEMFESQDCDCVQQLEKALEIISEKGGILFYLIQEGRGCGYIGKARACQMVQYHEYHDKNFSTFDAYKNLGMKNNNYGSVGSYLIFLPYNTAIHPKRIVTSIWTTGMDKYLDNQNIFFQNIDSNIKNKLRLRYKLHGTLSKKSLSNHVSNLRESKKTYKQDLNRARILVSTSCSTTILESLALNIPTVSFFDADSDRLNNHASKYFDMLADVGILHYDPLSAANFINSIWDDVETWWRSEKVKKAKRIFLKEFANLTENSEDEFLSQLIRVYNAQNGKN